MKEDNSKDLVYDISEDTLALIDSGVIPSELINVRDIINDFNPAELDEYTDTLLYRVYYVAKRKHTNSSSVIAHELKISRKLLDYYIEKYPKVAVAIQAGMMDSREDMKATLVDSLFNAAKGQTITEVSTSTETVYDSEGAPQGSKQKISEVKKFIPPNVPAALELMRKLDPSWVPNVKVDVDATVTQNMHVVEDINVAIDYKRLSKEALRELIMSQKSITSGRTPAFRLETGESVRSLRAEPVEEVVTDTGEVVLKPVEKRKPKGVNTRAHKTKLLLNNHNRLVNDIKKQAKEEADEAIKKET